MLFGSSLGLYDLSRGYIAGIHVVYISQSLSLNTQKTTFLNCRTLFEESTITMQEPDSAKDYSQPL